MRKFIEEILKEDFKENYENIFENSELLQYIDKKTNAITGNSKSRKNLGNIYAIYAFMYFYSEKFYNDPENYKKFEGFEYSDLWNFCKKQYGGEKIQNHALNNRLNTEFANKVAKEPEKMLLIINGSKYLMHIDYIYVNGIDISLSVLKIIKKYIELLFEKDMKLINDLEDLMQENDINKKKSKIINLLDEDSEARIFEIISFAVLKAHYKNEKIYAGKKNPSLWLEKISEIICNLNEDHISQFNSLWNFYNNHKNILHKLLKQIDYQKIIKKFRIESVSKSEKYNHPGKTI